MRGPILSTESLGTPLFPAREEALGREARDIVLPRLIRESHVPFFRLGTDAVNDCDEPILS